MRFVFLLFFALNLYAFDQEFLLQKFSEELQECRFEKAKEWLAMWGETSPENKEIASHIEKLMGYTEDSSKALEGLLANINLPEKDVSLIRDLHDFRGKLQCDDRVLHSNHPYRQPGDLTFKYMAQVTGLIIGMALMPVCPQVGLPLIISTGALLGFDTIPSAVGNKWDHHRSTSSRNHEILSLHKQIRKKLSSKFKDLGIEPKKKSPFRFLKYHPIYLIFGD